MENYIAFCPPAAFEVAARAVSDQRGITVPPEEWDSVEIMKIGKPTLSWSVLLEYGGMFFVISMGARGENPWVRDEITLTFGS